MIIVIWNKNGMRLRVLEVFEGKWGETCLMVCKETAPNPIMGLFSVRADQTSLLDHMVWRGPVP
jgi:hypothetical protein